MIEAGSEQAMGVYLAGKRGVLPKWLPAKAWESFRDDHFVIAADTAMMRREMKTVAEHSPPIVQAALLANFARCGKTPPGWPPGQDWTTSWQSTPGRRPRMPIRR